MQGRGKGPPRPRRKGTKALTYLVVCLAGFACLAAYVWYQSYVAAAAAIAGQGSDAAATATAAAAATAVAAATGSTDMAGAAGPAGAVEGSLRGSAGGAGDAAVGNGAIASAAAAAEVEIPVRPAVNIPPVPRSGVPSHWTPVNVGGGRDPTVTLCKLDYDTYWRHPVSRFFAQEDTERTNELTECLLSPVLLSRLTD